MAKMTTTTSGHTYGDGKQRATEMNWPGALVIDGKQTAPKDGASLPHPLGPLHCRTRHGEVHGAHDDRYAPLSPSGPARGLPAP